MHTYICTHIYIYIYIHVCVLYVYIHIYIYIYMYIHTYIHTYIHVPVPKDGQPLNCGVLLLELGCAAYVMRTGVVAYCIVMCYGA